jgi:hypothetical protein
MYNNCEVILLRKTKLAKHNAQKSKFPPLEGMVLDYKFVFKILKINNKYPEKEITFINYSSSELKDDKCHLYNMARNYNEQALFGNVIVGESSNGKLCAKMSSLGVVFKGYANQKNK